MDSSQREEEFSKTIVDCLAKELIAIVALVVREEGLVASEMGDGVSLVSKTNSFRSLPAITTFSTFLVSKICSCRCIQDVRLVAFVIE
jgi:hypothetical protein